MPPNSRLLQWISSIAQRAGYAARSYRIAFYVALAGVFVVLIGLNALVEALVPAFKTQSLDFTVRHRLSSPKPDPRIIILDIDERTLALMGEKYGRWPWPRSVLAEAIATLNDHETRAIVLNVMFSDPDKSNPEADQVFAEVAATTERVAYPLIRLNPKNDAQSQVKVSLLSGNVILDKSAADKTIAVLFPFFPATHDKLGVANLVTGADGVVRHYAVWLNELGFRLPSLAQRAVTAAGLSNKLGEHEVEDGILLNWRNKRGDYRRVSFADAYAAMNGEGQLNLAMFRDSVVIIGVSAPGIATVKGTAASPMMDDNTIIATAIDDVTNGTYLRRLPNWLSAIISLFFIGTLVWAFYVGIPDTKINRWFGFGQGMLLIVTLGSASYTAYLLDLTDSFFFALAFFTIAKLYAIVDRNTARGMPIFARAGSDPSRDRLIVAGFPARNLRKAALAALRYKLEHLFGVRHVFLLDNVFGDEHLFADLCGGWNYLVIFAGKQQCRETSDGQLEVNDGEKWIAFDELMRNLHVKGHTRSVVLPANATEDSLVLQRTIGEQLLEVSAQMLQAGR